MYLKATSKKGPWTGLQPRDGGVSSKAGVGGRLLTTDALSCRVYGSAWRRMAEPECIRSAEVLEKDGSGLPKKTPPGIAAALPEDRGHVLISMLRRWRNGAVRVW